MHFALQCFLADNVEEKRLALRPTHLQFMNDNKDRILCGGPIVDLEGKPEIMLIILNAPDRYSAEAFIQAEPYNRSGVFRQVIIREWRQVLPEAQPGALLHEISRTEDSISSVSKIY